MSESEQCPLCGAEAINQDIEFAFGVCTDCGYVIRSREHSVDTDQTEVTDNPASFELSDGWDQLVEVRDSSEQNLVDLLSMTETLGETVLISPGGQIRAGEIATEAWKKKILHGRSMDAGAGGAVHIACRELGCPRPARTIADAVEIDVSTLHEMYRLLVDVLGIDLDAPQPIDFVQFICDSLGCSASETMTAQELLRDQDEDIAGNPAGIAAAAVYIAVQDTTAESVVTYREVAQTVKMTKETVWRKSTEIRQTDSIR